MRIERAFKTLRAASRPDHATLLDWVFSPPNPENGDNADTLQHCRFLTITCCLHILGVARISLSCLVIPSPSPLCQRHCPSRFLSCVPPQRKKKGRLCTLTKKKPDPEVDFPPSNDRDRRTEITEHISCFHFDSLGDFGRLSKNRFVLFFYASCFFSPL